MPTSIEFKPEAAMFRHYFWQVGHQNTLRPSSTVVRIGALHTRHGSPERR